MPAWGDRFVVGSRWTDAGEPAALAEVLELSPSIVRCSRGSGSRGSGGGTAIRGRVGYVTLRAPPTLPVDASPLPGFPRLGKRVSGGAQRADHPAPSSLAPSIVRPRQRRQDACVGGTSIMTSDDYCAPAYRGPCETPDTLPRPWVASSSVDPGGSGPGIVRRVGFRPVHAPRGGGRCYPPPPLPRVVKQERVGTHGVGVSWRADPRA